MDIDTLHPGGGVYIPQPSTEQKQRKNKRNEAVANSIPILEEFLATLDESIAKADSLDNVDLRIANSVPVESQIIAMRHVKALLARERAKYRSQFKSYIKATS